MKEREKLSTEMKTPRDVPCWLTDQPCPRLRPRPCTGRASPEAVAEAVAHGAAVLAWQEVALPSRRSFLSTRTFSIFPSRAPSSAAREAQGA